MKPDVSRKNTQGSAATYTYNDENQLTQITFPGSPSRWQKFYYDGLGRRVQIDYYKEGSPDPVLVSRQKFVYLGGSVIRELNGSDQVVREYVRDGGLGGGIGSIIYCKEGSDCYYFHYNHKGDVISITDADKEEVAYYEYDAWGNMMTEAGSWSSPYRFSTKEWDDDSGLYYFGARYYSPEIGRWTQRDPAGVEDGLNVYLYADCEPVVRTDSWGLACGVYYYRSGRARVWAYLHGEGCHYWIEGFGRRFGLGDSGGGTDPITGYTGDFDYSVKWNTVKLREGKMQVPKTWENGKPVRYREVDCCDADCSEIKQCMLAVADTTKPYNWWTHHCKSFADELLEKCCLKRGSINTVRPNRPPPTKMTKDDKK